MKKKIKKDSGILFWITGLSGTGKSTIGKNIYKDISKKFGPTILINGDDFRDIFDLKSYSKEARLSNCKKFVKYCKFITKQKINVIFTVVGMYNQIRTWNRKNIPNYIEIYIKANVLKIIKKKKKPVYTNYKKDIVGMDIKAELPKKPDIIINNDFEKDMKYHSRMLIKKLNTLKN
jgi:adenylylsulfate kinase-like enzyme